MSTPTINPTPSPTPAASGSRGRTVVIAAGSAVAGAAILAGLVFGLGGFGTAAPATPAASSSTSAHAGGTGHHVTPAKPSAAIETLQKELGQLDYYEGPITGTMNEQTVQAITYLQRDAGLPRTGTMNAATQAALAHMLVTGNNQMGGN